MDIFNRKKVEKLESVKRGLEYENDSLRRALDETLEHLSNLAVIRDKIPEDCTIGSYCSACEFSEPFHCFTYVSGCRVDRTYSYSPITYYACRKGNICKNFIQKELGK